MPVIRINLNVLLDRWLVCKLCEEFGRKNFPLILEVNDENNKLILNCTKQNRS